MKLFIVYMHNNMPPILTFGETRAKVGRTIKKFMGPDMVDEVIPISNQDAEAEYGYNYKQQARWNMIRSESVENSTSVLTGDNPFLREKINMKKADMGDVIDDFYTSDAPQFQGKSKAKRRQMAIAAKLSANEQVKEEFNIDIQSISEGVNAKVLKTFKDMIKGGEEDNVRLLLQGMPKHTKTMYMKRLGLSEEIKTQSKNYKESLSILNKAVQEGVHDDKGHYKMTYTKRDGEHLHVHHTAVDFKGEKPGNPNRVKALVQDSPQHKDMISKGYNADKYGEHDTHEFHKTGKTITKEDVNEEMMGHNDAEKLGKSKDSNFSNAASHIDYHLRRHPEASSASGGKRDKLRHQVAKKLGYVNEDISKMPDSHVKFFATKNISHGRYTRAEIDDEHKRRQKVVPNYHSVKPSINEDEIEETPKKKFIQDPKLKNLKMPNPKLKRMPVDFYKGQSLDDDVNEDAFTKKAVETGKVKTGASKSRIAAMQKQDDNRPTLRKETKEAPPGTYFTRSGQLKKGDPASDGPGGAKLASDPLDKQRKTIVNLKNYPK